MTLIAQNLTPDFAVAPQISPSDLAEIAARGFKSVVNNRPDREGGPEQPLGSSIEAAAQAAGLHYVHIPVVSGAYSAEQIQAMRNALDTLPKPVLAFCRSGGRCTQLFGLVQSAG